MSVKFAGRGSRKGECIDLLTAGRRITDMAYLLTFGSACPMALRK